MMERFDRVLLTSESEGGGGEVLAGSSASISSVREEKTSVQWDAAQTQKGLTQYWQISEN